MPVYEVGPFRLNADQLLLLHGSQTVALGPKVVETLLALIERQGEVVSKRDMMDRIWPDGFVEEGNLTQNVHALRKAFARYGGTDPIETVPRRGYRLTISARLANDTAPHPAPQRMRSRIPAALAGVAIVAAFLILGAANGFGRHVGDRPALTSEGARLYEVGRYYWNLRTRDGVRKSLDYFGRVIDSDPNDARGYAGMAEANLSMGDYCYGTHRPSTYYARAQAYATKALLLDADSVEAHAALGALALNRRNVTEAIAQLQRAVSVDPTYAPAQEWYGIALLRHGHSSEGAAHLKQAGALDPLSVSTTAWLASVAYTQRRFADAVVYAQQALELSPDRTDALTTLGRAYEKQGNVAGAISAFARYRALSRYDRAEAAALLSHAYALSHQISEARQQYHFARAHAAEVEPADLRAAAAAVGVSHPVPTKGRAHHAAVYS